MPAGFCINVSRLGWQSCAQTRGPPCPALARPLVMRGSELDKSIGWERPSHQQRCSSSLADAGRKMVMSAPKHVRQELRLDVVAGRFEDGPRVVAWQAGRTARGESLLRSSPRIRSSSGLHLELSDSNDTDTVVHHCQPGANESRAAEDLFSLRRCRSFLNCIMFHQPPRA